MPLAGDQWLIFIVRFIHIFAGILWVGAITFNAMILSRKLGAAPPTVRGPAMALIGPASVRYGMWAGAVTIVFGAINQVLITQQKAVPGPEWHMVIGLTFLVAVVMLGIAGAIVAPNMRRMAAGPAPAEAQQIAGRLRVASLAGVGLGFVAVLLMVYATKLRVV